MKVIHTNIPDVKIIEPTIFGDKRGFFLETFRNQRYKDVLCIKTSFVQDNHSRSHKNTLRGLHFQKLNPQGKLVRVVSGSVFDVAVDIRPNSPTFGKSTFTTLSAENKRQQWIPPGFAHGFLVLSEFADFEYKCTDYYDPSDEGCIRWNDPQLNIKWPTTNPILSPKDQDSPLLSEIVL